ncbi:MAG TPA: hypothetical protein PKD86_13110 [Gemmatales bacterium]|nr:hypothetical protein [Gemmatales bacterium]HMP60281.1 hypothetical protein [Gemmatales bacterium]
MQKGLCYGVMGVSALFALLFLLDMFLGFPFAGASIALDIFGVIASGILAYLAWDTSREIR